MWMAAAAEGRSGMTSSPPCCSDLGWKEEVMMDEQMDMEPERAVKKEKVNLIVVSKLCLEIRRKERKSHPEMSYLLS